MTETAARPALSDRYTATSIQGSQLACTLPGATRDGVIGIWYGKAPGLDRASDDPAAKSSTLPCTSDAALADLNTPPSASSSATW